MLFRCSGYLELDSKFLVTNNEEVLTLIDTYSRGNVDVATGYADRIKSFLRKERKERGKLLPYVKNLASL